MLPGSSKWVTSFGSPRPGSWIALPRPLDRLGLAFGSPWPGLWIALAKPLDHLGQAFGSPGPGLWIAWARPLDRLGQAFGSPGPSLGQAFQLSGPSLHVPWARPLNCLGQALKWATYSVLIKRNGSAVTRKPFRFWWEPALNVFWAAPAPPRSDNQCQGAGPLDRLGGTSSFRGSPYKRISTPTYKREAAILF